MPAVKPTATAEAGSPMKSAAKLAAAGTPSAYKALVRETSPRKAIAVEIAVEPAPCKEARAVKAAAVKPVEPRSGADKHSTQKPLRPIIPVRRAGLRVVAIIAVGTGRWRPKVDWAVTIAGAHAYAHKHALRARQG